MRRFVTLFSLLLLGSVCAAQTQTPAPAPKPSPELKKLQVLIGRWTYDGEYKPGPFGPGGKIAGEYTAQWKLNGFVVEATAVEKGATQTTHFLEVDEYKDKAINWTMWATDGTRMAGTITVNANTVTWEGRFMFNGKEYLMKEAFVLAADNMSGTATGDVSADGGKTWMPWYSGKYTKAAPAAKPVEKPAAKPAEKK